MVRREHRGQFFSALGKLVFENPQVEKLSRALEVSIILAACGGECMEEIFASADALFSK